MKQICFAKLQRCGGSDVGVSIPEEFRIITNIEFFGRFPQPPLNSELKFTHTNQFVIPCLYVSSTHFSITREKDLNTNTYNYFVKDYSRNGTFVNDKLVGNGKQTLISNSDIISLKYKDEVRLAYKFSISDQPLVKQEEVSPQMDKTTEHLTQQLNFLQGENARLEAKANNYQQKNESLILEMDKLNRKSRSDEKTQNSLQQEISDLKERISVFESNSSAIEARNRILEENYEDAQEEIKVLKQKGETLSEQLEEKIVQFEGLQKFVEDSNKALTHEKSLRGQLDNTLSIYKTTNNDLEDKIKKITMANQALQSIIGELEVTVNNKKKEYLILSQKYHQLQAMLNSYSQQTSQYSKILNEFKIKFIDLVDEFPGFPANDISPHKEALEENLTPKVNNPGFLQANIPISPIGFENTITQKMTHVADIDAMLEKSPLNKNDFDADYGCTQVANYDINDDENNNMYPSPEKITTPNSQLSLKSCSSTPISNAPRDTPFENDLSPPVTMKESEPSLISQESLIRKSQTPIQYRPSQDGHQYQSSTISSQTNNTSFEEPSSSKKRPRSPIIESEDLSPLGENKPITPSSQHLLNTSDDITIQPDLKRKHNSSQAIEEEENVGQQLEDDAKSVSHIFSPQRDLTNQSSGDLKGQNDEHALETHMMETCNPDEEEDEDDVSNVIPVQYNDQKDSSDDEFDNMS